ncbi:unnamed protein product [Ilex paraguariensis]|uniref:Secreted protein n=1 Tax=Ilex paraguariensis TaxID=185542 RepID=A0ABC8TUM0_9AQUA
MAMLRISSRGLLNGVGSLMGLYLLRFFYTTVQGLRIVAGMMPRVMLCIGDVCCLCILKATKCLPESVWFKGTEQHAQ